MRPPASRGRWRELPMLTGMTPSLARCSLRPAASGCCERREPNSPVESRRRWATGDHVSEETGDHVSEEWFCKRPIVPAATVGVHGSGSGLTIESPKSARRSRQLVFRTRADETALPGSPASCWPCGLPVSKPFHSQSAFHRGRCIAVRYPPLCCSAAGRSTESQNVLAHVYECKS